VPEDRLARAEAQRGLLLLLLLLLLQAGTAALSTRASLSCQPLVCS
jgi:hypothetical protein